MLDASADEAQLRRWWPEGSEANIAIATGPESGVDVADVDPKHNGDANFIAVAQANGMTGAGVPDTLEVETGSGGSHLYFKSAGFVTKANSLAPGVDTRGEGGYVIAPPSLHASGRRYSWVSPPGTPVADAPRWMIELAQRKGSKAPPPTVDDAAFWRPPERDEISEAEIWKRLDKPEHAEAVQRMKAGEALFAPGTHDASLWGFLSYLRFRLQCVSDATLLRLLAPSVTAMACEAHGLTHVAGKLAKANADLSAKLARSARESEALLSRFAPPKASSSDGTEDAQPSIALDEWRYPMGYAVLNDSGVPGVYKHTNSGLVAVAAAPISISGYGEDEVGNVFSEIKWVNGAVRTRVIPRLHAAGPELLGLAAFGAPVTAGNRPLLQTFLQAQEQELLSRGLLPQFRIYTQSGWAPDNRSFVIGRQVIGEPGRVLMPGADAFLDALVPKGSPEEHARLCTLVRERGHVAEMVLAAGFAAPLLRPLELRSMCVSIWGQSGSGKSAVQATAASVWGRPSGMKVSGDVSKAALEGEFARSRDLPTWVDDTQLMGETTSAIMAYVIGAETSGARATQTGGLRERKNWRTLAIISGEKSLLQIGGAAGAKNRTLELRAKPLGDMALAQRVHRGLDQHHGHAGPTLVRHLLDRYILTDRVHELRQEHRRLTEQLSRESSEQARYVGLLVLADVLSRKVIFGEDEATATKRALDAGRAFFAETQQAAQETESTAEVAYEHILSFVAANLNGFSGFSSGHSETLGVIEEMEGKRVAIILADPMRRLGRDHGFDVRQVLTDLSERGLVLREPPHLSRRVTVNKQRVRAYCVVIEDAEPLAPVPVAPA